MEQPHHYSPTSLATPSKGAIHTTAYRSCNAEKESFRIYAEISNAPM
jgi:hypothetical protein